VDGPEGRFVIRAEPRGVPLWSAMRWNPLPYVLRLLKRNSAWVVRVRARADDPLGKPLYEETVPSKADVAEAMTRVTQRVRSGLVGSPDSGGNPSSR
jgi:hypothetical protein